MKLFSALRISALSMIAAAAPLGAQAQSLTEALTYAYSNSPYIASAFLSVKSAAQDSLKAQGKSLPTIGAAASYDFIHNLNTGVDTQKDSLGLSYSQTLFNGAGIAAGLDAANVLYDIAIYQSKATEQDLLGNVISAYVNVASFRRIVQIREENIGFVRAQVTSAKDRLEIGEGTRLDVAQAEASLAQAEAEYQAAISTLRAYEATYQLYVGKAPGNLTGGYNYTRHVPNTVDGAIDRALSSHPSILAANAKMSYADFAMETTKAAYGPNLKLNGAAGVGGFAAGSITPTAQIGLSLSVPLFTPDRDPDVEKANIARIQAEMEAKLAREQITFSIRQNFATLSSAAAQIESASAAVAASRLALQAVIDQNEVGQSTTLDVLNARASLLNVELVLVNAQASRTIAGYSLVSATGNLSVTALGLPVAPRTVEGTLIVSPSTAPTGREPVRDAWGNLR